MANILDTLFKSAPELLNPQKNVQAPEDTTDTDIEALLEKIANRRKGLYEETEAKGSQFLEDITGQRKTRLSELSELLRGREDQLFSESQPGILEGLSSRGLLHSSGVGEEFAKERGRLAQGSEFALRQQEMADMDTEQRIAEDIQNRLFGIQSGGLETDTGLWQSGLQRKYSLQDLSSQMALMEKIASMQGDSANLGSLMQLIGTIAPMI